MIPRHGLDILTNLVTLVVTARESAQLLVSTAIFSGKAEITRAEIGM